jgi:hypothetical protein
VHCLGEHVFVLHAFNVADSPARAPRFSGVQLCDDVRPASWLESQLWPWERGRLRIGSLVPEGYPAYGRILHPAYNATDYRRIRWSEIAERTARALDAETRFNELVGWRPGPDQQEPPSPWRQPVPGSLEPDECDALARVLAQHTSTPDRCWFCLWEGYGWPELPAPGTGPPRVHLEHRECLLFSGPARDASAFRSGPWFQSPTLWWPDDRAWCVASELDIFSTYVAADTACLDTLMREVSLEVLPCSPDQHVDPSPYPA